MFFFSTSINDKLHRIVVLGDTGVGKTSIVKVSIYILIIMFIMVMVMVVSIIIINITKLSGWSCKRLTRFTSATDHITKDPPPQLHWFSLLFRSCWCCTLWWRWWCSQSYCYLVSIRRIWEVWIIANLCLGKRFNYLPWSLQIIPTKFGKISATNSMTNF